MKLWTSDTLLDRRIQGLKQSATLEINERSTRMISEGRKIYKLGLGQSPFSVPRIVQESLKSNTHQKDYLPVKGLISLREQVAEYYQQRFGVNYHPDNILIGPGSKELIYMLQYSLNAELLLPVPSWVSYFPQSILSQRQCGWMNFSDTHNYYPIPEEMEEYLKSDNSSVKMVLLNYPNNPTGSSYDAGLLQKLAELFRNYRTVVISDEIYAELYYKGTHTTIASYYPEGTIITGGMSKWCGAGGWRLGLCLVPDQLSFLSQALANMASESFTSVSAPIQYAAITAYQFGKEIDEYVSKSNAVLKILAQEVEKQMLSLQLTMPELKAGFYFMPDFEYYREKLMKRNIMDCDTLSLRLLEDTGVASLPGSVFGLKRENLILRMAFVDFDGDQAFGQLDRGEISTEKLAPRIVEALKSMKQWLEQL